MDQERRDFLQDSARLGGFAVASAALWRIESVLAQGGPGHELATMTIVELSQLLASQKITSRQLVEQALAAIKDPQGEGVRTFLSVHESEALTAADKVDAQRRGGAKLPTLAGIPISIKDLFDEAGVTTLGGSKVLVGTPAATRDSSAVERLKKAGAVIIGRTNLVEFAYSGLGINPHYGTPKNVFDRATGRIPGGSSSGAAVSVTDGMAAGAIGTDTGGSIRIPAALNGLVGFKPTARRVPLDGVLPLSFTLDSAGPIAKTVADCALLDQVLAAEARDVPAPAPLRGLHLAVPTTVFQNDLSPAVADTFRAALARLSAAGATVVELPMEEFAQAGRQPARCVDQCRGLFVAQKVDERRGRQIRRARHRPHPSWRNDDGCKLHRTDETARAVHPHNQRRRQRLRCDADADHPGRRANDRRSQQGRRNVCSPQPADAAQSGHRQPFRWLRPVGSLP
jgi:aspartyl-tRNA(Asn)/glutamyl-tRNA(Gln) amidotransferase subunit A